MGSQKFISALVSGVGPADIPQAARSAGEVQQASAQWTRESIRILLSSTSPGSQAARRMDRLWPAWAAHPRNAQLVFRCSIEHPRFAAEWLGERGVRVEAVFAGPGSADRSDCVEQLAPGGNSKRCA